MQDKQNLPVHFSSPHLAGSSIKSEQMEQTNCGSFSFISSAVGMTDLEATLFLINEAGAG